MQTPSNFWPRHTIQMWPPCQLHTAWWVVNETGKEVTFVSCMVCRGQKLLGVCMPLEVILNQLMANEVANILSMWAFFNIFKSWVSQIQICCIEALPFYMPKMIIQDAVSQITDINHIQITCKEALPFYMPKMIFRDAVLFDILNNHFRHARRQSFFASNLYLW